MKLEDILSTWKEDVKIEKTELGDEALKISRLYHKYREILIHERMALNNLEDEMKVLRKEKYIFFKDGPSKEDLDKGWELPPKGTIIKQDINLYLEADKDIINLARKIRLQEEKISVIETIFKELGSRGFQIKACIDWIKWTQGG